MTNTFKQKWDVTEIFLKRERKAREKRKISQNDSLIKYYFSRDSWSLQSVCLFLVHETCSVLGMKQTLCTFSFHFFHCLFSSRFHIPLSLYGREKEKKIKIKNIAAWKVLLALQSMKFPSLKFWCFLLSFGWPLITLYQQLIKLS